MNPKIVSFLKHYFFGLLTSCWNGGWAAVSGILGIDAVALTAADQAVGLKQDTPVLNMHQMVSCFLGAVVLHAVIYFKSHPLPETFSSDTNPPIPRT